MIRNPNDIQDGAKKIRMLIAGYPGIGKSTLALSAPRPLHIDCDFGIDRIEPRYRMPYIQPRSYDEILNDLKPENLKDFETLVFDTAGKLITLMGLWAIKQNPKYGQRDGSLSLKGYGFVGREFVRLMDYCFYELKKNIVVVFHATEEKDGDNTRLRIKVEGQTKNNVWEPMDLGGFVEMYGNDRTIGFSNCEKYFAKGTRGIHGVYKIPALGPGSPNDFLTKLFEEYNSKAAEEVAANAKENEAYEQVMQEGSKIIAGIKKHRNKRSHSANAYFHVLVNKIAAETGESDDLVKERLVVAYGTVARDKDGCTVGFKLPASVDVHDLYKYTRCFDVREEDGKRFNCYLVYKDTSKMDTKEFSHLIDGAIEEAKALGIETDTPEQLARYKEEWSK